ncbi:hypothetical protein PVAP13_7KG101036 [Panicum virgatum]|uniref:Uncharacterized protein n=1 Tax=Panicum virgatum TaxID=38727 RepID=A0A8T0QA53_PANVG|nr:hypothetical protein PVAP13_7KG101036 [Panicum virgatum]
MGFLIYACLLHLLLSTADSGVAAQSQPLSPARILDATLQDYAFRAFEHPRTGIVYNATLPANLTGIALSAVRLRSGSLRRKGFADYFQFGVPTGVVVQPHVERVVLVYHNLGSSSDHYYPLSGHTYLAPVLGLLAYDAANLSSVGLQELNIVASRDCAAAVRGVRFKWCAAARDLEATNAGSTYRQGHISIVVNSSEIAPAPAPPGSISPPIPTPGGQKKGNSKAWKIAVSVVGAAIALGLLAVLLLCLVRYKRDKKLEAMERNAEVGETLRVAQVGRTQAPVALGTRTQPVIENDYAA